MISDERTRALVYEAFPLPDADPYSDWNDVLRRAATVPRATPPVRLWSFLTRRPTPPAPSIDARHPRSAWSRLAFVGVALALLAAVAVSAFQADDRGYVRQNHAILDQLPRFPGTVLIEEHDGEWAEEAGRSARATGWLTRRVYRLPAGVRADEVITYYEERLRSWTVNHRLDGPVVNFCRDDEVLDPLARGRASLSLNLENHAIGLLEIAVDAHGCRDENEIAP
jgi:hypothetical protein